MCLCLIEIWLLFVNYIALILEPIQIGRVKIEI